MKLSIQFQSDILSIDKLDMKVGDWRVFKRKSSFISFILTMSSSFFIDFFNGDELWTSVKIMKSWAEILF